MENILSLIFFIFGLLLFSALCILTFLVITKSSRIRKLEYAIQKLSHSFEKLDEQAKLIVKTDLELNKAQEELDRRLSSLDTLQKTSRLISTSLDETEIFQRLDQSIINELGFENILLLIFDQNSKLHNPVHLGFAQDTLPYIISNISKDTDLIDSLTQGHTFTPSNVPQQRKEIISKIFDIEHFILTPILMQNELAGMFFAGNRFNMTAITEGDEELISILSNQIAQALQNARLFEEVYKSRQNLEIKVQERTHQLEKALTEVQKISKTKSEFISAVSHELRTPLTSIKGFAELLVQGKLGEIPEKARQRLIKINTQSDNLVQLINNLLDISRIESGRVEMKKEECNLREMAENVYDMLTPQFKDKDINWICNIGSEIPELILDKVQAERIFINLIGNATKFTPNQGTIGVKAELENNIVTVDIFDSGIGIPEEDITRLFDEFFRVENQINQNVKGTGLGLALAKKIVEAHNGRMWVTSKVGQGTTFHFTLPLIQS